MKSFPVTLISLLVVIGCLTSKAERPRGKSQARQSYYKTRNVCMFVHFILCRLQTDLHQCNYIPFSFWTGESQSGNPFGSEVVKYNL